MDVAIAAAVAACLEYHARASFRSLEVVDQAHAGAAVAVGTDQVAAGFETGVMAVAACASSACFDDVRLGYASEWWEALTSGAAPADTAVAFAHLAEVVVVDG